MGKMHIRILRRAACNKKSTSFEGPGALLGRPVDGDVEMTL